MDPAPVYASIERLRYAPAERDPNAATARLGVDAERALDEAVALVPRPLRRLVRRATMVARLGAIARERAKDILVMENLGARRALHELMCRARDRGGPEDLRLGFCVTIEELPGYLADPRAYLQVIADRSATERYLNDRLPPPWFVGRIPPVESWELRAGAADTAPIPAKLNGLGVSGGRASGPARVIADPADPRGLEPGEILVCAITDPSWTPLFLAAAAVVCDTGAMQSHAAIVARELGLPAVMSVPRITTVADGTILHVNGDQGTVEVG
jgi:pyruvate,water dikinase